VGVSEDLDWSLRARTAGFTLAFAPGAIVGHPARRSWPELAHKWRRINTETLGLSLGRKGAKLRWLLRNSLLPVSAIVHTPRVLAHREVSSLTQKAGALAILYRLRLWRMADAIRALRACED
jgi:hypothetical protein